MNAQKELDEAAARIYEKLEKYYAEFKSFLVDELAALIEANSSLFINDRAAFDAKINTYLVDTEIAVHDFGGVFEKFIDHLRNRVQAFAEMKQKEFQEIKEGYAESMDWLITRADEITKRGWRLDSRHIFQGSYDVFNSIEEDLKYQALKQQRLADAVVGGWLELGKDGFGSVYVMTQKAKDKLKEGELNDQIGSD